MTTEKVYSEGEGFYVGRELHIRAIVYTLGPEDAERLEFPVPIRMCLPPLDFSPLLSSSPECYPPDLTFVHQLSGTRFGVHSQILKATGVIEREKDAREFCATLAATTVPESSIRDFLEYLYLKPFDYQSGLTGSDLSRLFRLPCLLLPKTHPLYFEFELAFFNSLANSTYDSLMAVLRTELVEPLQDFPFKRSAVPLLIARIRNFNPSHKFDKDMSKWMSAEISAMTGDDDAKALRVERLSLRLLKASKMAYGPVAKKITPEWKDVLAKDKVDSGGIRISMDSFKTIWSQFLHRTTWFPVPVGGPNDRFLHWIDKDAPLKTAVDTEDPIAESSAPSCEPKFKVDEPEEEESKKDMEVDSEDDDEEESEVSKDDTNIDESASNDASSSKTEPHSPPKSPVLGKRAKKKLKQEKKERKVDDSAFDFTFEIAGHNKYIIARGLIIYSKWPWFRAMLESGMTEAREKRATLPSSISPNVLRAALMALEDIPCDFPKMLTTDEQEWVVMEGGQLGLTDADMKPIPAFLKLVGSCRNAILPHLNKDNSLMVLFNAKKLNLPDLFEQAMAAAITLGKAGFSPAQGAMLSKDVAIAARVIAGIGDKLSMEEHASADEIKNRPKAKKKEAELDASGGVEPASGN